MKTKFEFELKCLNDSYGNGWWRGLEPHPKKSIGYIISQEDGRFSLEVREIKISYTSEEKYVSWQRSAVSETANVLVDFGDLLENVVSLGVLIQGRNDWSGTSFTSTDGKDHPEDATWSEVFWLYGGALGRCPVCLNKLTQDVAHYKVENEQQWTTRVLGQRCTACGQLWKDNVPVPRSWTKNITSLVPEVYSDDFMSEREWLKEVFGVTGDSFPPQPYGPYVIEFEMLNHFDRISGSGTVMWSYPCIRLFWDGSTWDVFNKEDAVNRMKIKLRAKGHKVNRNTKKMIEILSR